MFSKFSPHFYEQIKVVRINSCKNVTKNDLIALICKMSTMFEIKIEFYLDGLLICS